MTKEQRKVYRHIMECVSEQVKAALFEGFEFESDPVVESIKKIMSTDDRIKAICKNADLEEMKDLTKALKEVATGDAAKYAQMPKVIKNISALAAAILSKMDIREIQVVKTMDEDALEELASSIFEKDAEKLAALESKDAAEENK